MGTASTTTSANTVITGHPAFLTPPPLGRPRPDRSGIWDFFEPVVFRDSHGTEWTTDDVYESDGASIPRPLWSSFGHPFHGQFVRAAVIHDVYYEKIVRVFLGPSLARARKAVDKMFYEALRTDGVPPIKAYLMYTGVRMGGWRALQDKQHDNNKIWTGE
jgi:hypothetical protein